MRRDTSSATDDREVWQPFASLEHAGELPRTSRREDEGREDGAQARAADVLWHVPPMPTPYDASREHCMGLCGALMAVVSPGTRRLSTDLLIAGGERGVDPVSTHQRMQQDLGTGRQGVAWPEGSTIPDLALSNRRSRFCEKPC